MAAVKDDTIFNATSQYILSSLQKNTWLLVGYSPTVSASDIGTKPKLPDINPTAFALAPSGPAFVSPQNVATGLLGTIPTRYFASLTTGTVSPVPYYQITPGISDTAIDDTIAASLNSIILSIAKLDKSGLKGNTSAKNAVYNAAATLLMNLTHGGIYFNKIDHSNKAYSYNLHIGTAMQLKSIPTFPGAGARALLQQTQLSNGILRNGNVAGLGNAQITQGFRILPQVVNTKIVSNFAGVIGVILFPFGVSFLLPIFAILLIQDKEQRILIMMKMNGMKVWTYYVSQYIVFTILYWISMTFFIIAGRIFKLSLFTLTKPNVIFLVFFVWGNNLISLAFFFSAFFSRSQFALTSVFLIVLCSVIVSLALLEVFSSIAIPSAYFIWPPFAFYRLLGDLNKASFRSTLVPYTLSMLQPGDEVFTALVFMAVEVPIYLVLAYYFSAVLPSEFGVRLPWYFPVQSVITWHKNRKFRRANGGLDTREAEMANAVRVNVDETQFEDQDVRDERARVTDPRFQDKHYPLVMRNMRKVYAGRGGTGPKLAVKDVSFAVEKGIIFGLLGPNGAGKTTLISILTGLYESSVGEAKIAGFNVRTESGEVYKRIGICPQFDILWDDLTISEHLYFYARLKGIKSSDEGLVVDRAMKAVSLFELAKRKTKTLSGGEKRRVSIAIALLGDPKVIFFGNLMFNLDEPSTGLDPSVRRLIWDIINNAKEGRTIILTTHSMEEAEALCQRIGIMAKGTLRCLANPTRLKSLYGPGFKIVRIWH